jgi:EmrB/QacA subfamily drug resistance transporter
VGLSAEQTTMSSDAATVSHHRASDTQAGRKRATIIVACVAAFVVFIDTTIVNVAFPAIERSFTHAARAEVALTLTVYATLLGALLIPGGRVADYLGRRRVFITAFGGFVASSALCGAANSLEVLVAGRALQAVSAAFMAPASLGLLFPEFPDHRRSYVVGIWSAAAGAAAALGPALGGFLVDVVGWRSVFLVNLPIGLAAIAITKRRVVETRDPSATKPDTIGVILAVLAASVLTSGLFYVADKRTVTPLAVLLIVASLVLASLCTLRGRLVSNPLVGRQLMAHKPMILASLATAFTASAGFALLFVNVLFLSSVWHYSPLQQGLAVTPGPIVTALCVIPAGKLADRFGPRAVAIPGVLLLSAGALWFQRETGSTAHWFEDWLPGSLLTGSGIGLSFPPIAAAAIAGSRASNINTAVAVNGTLRQIGAIAGISAVVSLVGNPGEYAVVAFGHGWMLVAGLALAGGIAMIPFAPRGGLAST